MSNKVFLYGPSGFGKTASIRNLPPENTCIINTDRKPLPLAGWRNKYKKVTLEDGSIDWSKTNHISPTQPANVLMALREWEAQPWVKYIVIDTFTHLITSDYIYNAIGKDFKAYQNMGGNAFRIMDKIRSSKKNILLIGHSDVEYDQTGQKVVKMKAHGKMIDDMVPPSFFTTVLVPEVKRDENGTQYLFRTQSDGADAAKSPCYFDDNGAAIPALDLNIPNDIKFVFDKLEQFETNV